MRWSGELVKPILVDTHAHLGHQAFAGELPAVLVRAWEAGLGWVLNVADDMVSAAAGAQLAAREPRLFASVGVHPHQARTWKEETREELAVLLRCPKVVAVGETGLDYHYGFSKPAVQRQVFREHLKLAKEHSLPVIIHAREADGDLLEILSTFAPLEGVVHCFWSSADIARRYLDLGLYLGVGGAVTFRNSGALRETLRELPLERLLLETDAPYLTPHPYRGRRNEPAMVSLVAIALAELFAIDPEEVRRCTSRNAARLFKVDQSLFC